MVFLISVLIVYGVTLILVQGKIFEPAKIKLGKIVHNLQQQVEPTDDDVRQRIAMRTGISPVLLGTWDKGIKILSDSPKPEMEQDVQRIMDEAFQMIKYDIKYKSMPILILYRFLFKLQELLQCMMCTGFWIGLILCIVTSLFSISIFGFPLQIVTSVGYNVPIAMFLMACLFSGTTWIINSLVDLLFEVKENLGGFIKR